MKRTTAVTLMLAAGGFKTGNRRNRVKREDASFSLWKCVVYVAHFWVDV